MGHFGVTKRTYAKGNATMGHRGRVGLAVAVNPGCRGWLLVFMVCTWTTELVIAGGPAREGRGSGASVPSRNH